MGKWCEDWLGSSGVASLEPILTTSEDGRLTSLKVRQNPSLTGDQLLRLQKIDIGVYP